MKQWVLLVLLSTFLLACGRSMPERQRPAPKGEREKQAERNQRRKDSQAYRSLKISDLAIQKKPEKPDRPPRAESRIRSQQVNADRDKHPQKD
ncbi:MAG: hypothetical protein AB1898_31870 [Acidobacteriota bacterium]